MLSSPLFIFGLIGFNSGRLTKHLRTEKYDKVN